MEFIRIESDGRVRIVRLERGKANALNAAMIEDLLGVFEDAARSDAVGAIVLTGSGGNFFSSGFDVLEVFQYDRPTMRAFFGRFMDLYEGITRFPKPVVAAINGHAFAGGAILALACDARLMAEGSFGFALNEIDLGFALPPGIIRLAVDAVGLRSARKMVLDGWRVTPAQALEIGLAEDVVKAEDLLQRACARAQEMAQKPQSAYAAIKRTLLEVSGHGPDGDDGDNREALEPFLDHWFSPEAEQRKRALIESLSNRKAT